MECNRVFRHILVPLDGSRLAESTLATAGALAGKLGAQITLIHVVERRAPSEIHSERHLVTAEEASRYLEAISRAPSLSGLRVETHVHTAEVRDVARSIAEHSAELAPDLIAMCAHGKGGLRRMLWGAIAQQVVALGKTPVLIMRPQRERQAAVEIRRILAPVDGEPGHERGLTIAAGLAKVLGCRLRLLMVVPNPRDLSGPNAASSLFLPGAARTDLEMANAAARVHLERRIAEQADDGIEAESELARGDPARAIVKAARRAGADLVVMGTHGRAGADAFWEGSVAAQVASRVKAPLLLVPIGESQR